MGKTRSKRVTRSAETVRVFSDTDLVSGDGMLTTVWGPSLWHVLHTMSFNYPIEPTQEQRRHYRDFMLNLLYVYNLHELVNKMLKKKSGLTYEDVRERYEHFRARCTLDDPKVKMEAKGCTEPLYGKKAKGVIHIIPQDVKCDTIQINPECLKRRTCAINPSPNTK
jgi:hypothetical protein